MNHQQPTKLAHTISGATEASGIGRSQIYKFIKEGKLEARKLGSRVLIPDSSLRALLASLPRMTA
jgi:excisionase family DNA binding protein